MDLDKLRKLAEAMGKPFHPALNITVMDKWQPHKDPAQAMEVLEWLIQERNRLEIYSDLWINKPSLWAVCGEAGDTLPEAITLAALEVINGS